MSFTPEVIAAVTGHMNGDHPEDCLLIVQGLGGQPTATQARMTGVDSLGADFVATVQDQPVPVRVPWSGPITERAQIRTEVVALYHRACAALGVAPREAGEH